MIDIFNKLNTKQIDAVKTTEGKVRVTAGAGSGKTRVITHRYAYLVNELGISPSNILCVTFTNKAANEMKNRIATMVTGGNVNDFVCTIHGFCVKLLRKEIFRLGYPLNFSIMDPEDSKVLAKQVMEEFNVPTTQTTVKEFLKGVSLSKRFSHDPSYIAQYMLPESKNNGEKEFERYLRLQLKNFSLDFDDLILFTLHILENYDDAREYWQEKMNYIMVDEAQDFNGTNWRIIDILSAQYNNLFIVGDPDQAIYEWRGANPDLFLNFKPDSDFILDENYRSTPDILNVANDVIKHNKKRIKKNLFTNNGTGNMTVHYHGKNLDGESDWIANQISILKESGCNNSDFAILYRASYLSRSIEQTLLRKQINYVVWGGIRFFERKEIKDALAYLKLLVNKDDLSFRRIVNVPSRRFGRQSMNKVQEISDRENISLYEALKLFVQTTNNEQIQTFIQFIDESEQLINQLSISDLLDYLLNESGYLDMLRMDYSDEERLENLEELLFSIKYYEDLNKDDEITVHNYLQDIALYTNADYKQEGPSVKIMTIHQAKGLEFPYVFICGLTEGIFPSYRAIRERKEAALEEERRLMYVAITRAEKGLFLTESEGYNAVTQSDKYPSRFIGEIGDSLKKVEGNLPLELIEGTKMLVNQLEDEINPILLTSLNIGDIVLHKVFGPGRVLSYNDDEYSYKIKFNIGVRFLKPASVSMLKSIGDIQSMEEDPNEHENLICNPILQTKKIPMFTVGTCIVSICHGRGTVDKIIAKHFDVEPSKAAYIKYYEKAIYEVQFKDCRIKYRLSWPHLVVTSEKGGYYIGDFIIGTDGKIYQVIDSYRDKRNKQKKDPVCIQVWSVEDKKELLILVSEIKQVFLPMNNDHYYLVNDKEIWHLDDIEFDGQKTLVWFTETGKNRKMEFELSELKEYSFKRKS